MAGKTNGEFNFFKSIYFVQAAVAFLLLLLLAITPYQSSNQFVDITILGFKIFVFSSLALSYIIFFIGALGLIVADYLINEPDDPAGEVFDTATADVGKHYLLQNLGVPLYYCVIISVVLGAAYGLYLADSVYTNKQAYFFVPNFFSASPLQGVGAEQYNAVVSSFGVANPEEAIFVGIMGMLLWSLARLAGRYLGFHPLNFSFLLATLLIVALFNGYLVAFIFHAFVYGSQGYAFENAQRYFQIDTFATGATGTIFGGIIAHTIHNFAVKTARVTGSYQVLGGAFPSGFTFLNETDGQAGAYSVITVPVEK